MGYSRYGSRKSINGDNAMRIFQNYREYLASCTDIRSNSHMPPAKPYQWVC